LILIELVLATGIKAQSKTTHEITISAAISLKNAFEDIGKIFQEKNPAVKLVFNFGASGDLARQIEAGAPVDIFAPAAQKDMDDIERKGLLLIHSRVNLVNNTLVLVKPVHSNIRIESMKDLLRAETKRVVIGNPQTVPAGRYAEEVLRNLNLWFRVQDKLIFAEHVRQALDYVARNEVDAGLVYSTDARIRSKEVTLILKVPEGSHQPILYPMAVVKGTQNEILARKFVNFVIAIEAQRIFEQFGFTPLYHQK
jgi:molybdate transport system substrate-binding protein